ncbi:hypothetical protein D9M70_497430 [compost metagenome]
MRSWASTDISRTEVPPRLLISATWAPSPMTAARRSAMVATAERAPAKSICSTPASPWMPRPSSALPEGIRASFGEPGTRQVSSDMPMLRVPAITRLAAAVTVSRSAPRSASAPAILCTKRVPATPRACGRSGSAISSPTITMLTFSPKARARSAARPKFSRSPV